MTIYLVMHHEDGKAPFNGHGFQISHRGDGSNRYPGVGGHGHDNHAHCLRVPRETYKTRAEADAEANRLMAKHPGDYCFSLEVDTPKKRV